MEPPKRIAVFVATPWEMDAVRAAFPTGVERLVNGVRVRVCAVGSREYWLTRTGVGLQKASGVASRLLTAQPFCLAVSTGFACALIAAEVGALLAGGSVMFSGVQGSARSHTIDVPGPERNAVLALVSGSDPCAHVGLFVSADHVVGRASEKQRIARVTGAIGLDMESAALAIEAQRTRVPFVIVRTASDLLDEELPLDFNLFLRPTGWLKGVALALSSPASLRGLRRLRRQSVAAGRNLTAFFHRYVGAVATADAGARARPEIP